MGAAQLDSDAPSSQLLFIRRPDLRSSVIGVSDGIPRIDRDNQSNKEDV